MNKLLKSIVAVSVGVAMAIGVGVGTLNNKIDPVYADDYTITPANCGWTTSGAAQSSSPFTGITISTTNGTYSSSNGDFRVYKGQTMTVASSIGNIQSLAFTYSGSNNGGWANSYTPNAASWTSPATSGT